MMEIPPERSDEIRQLYEEMGKEPPLRSHRGWRWHRYVADADAGLEASPRSYDVLAKAGTITATYMCERYYGPLEQRPTTQSTDVAVAGFRYSRRFVGTALDPGSPGEFGLTVCHYLALPLWMPFVLLAAYPAMAFVRGPLRYYRRRGRGLCVKCGYDLTGNVSGVCSECGTPANANVHRKGGASRS
jgi:hypothetical protein